MTRLPSHHNGGLFPVRKCLALKEKKTKSFHLQKVVAYMVIKNRQTKLFLTISPRKSWKKCICIQSLCKKIIFFKKKKETLSHLKTRKKDVSTKEIRNFRKDQDSGKNISMVLTILNLFDETKS